MRRPCNVFYAALAFTAFALPSSLFGQFLYVPAVSTSAAAYGNCPAPTTAGVKVCFPAGTPPLEIASPIQVIASGKGSNGPVKVMEIWIDGKKLEQVNGNFFDMPINVPTGSHRLTVVELDTSGHSLKSTPINLSVQGSTTGQPCSPPSTPGVNDCLPGPGNCHTTGWTAIVASATPNSGSVARMELWANGTKLANFQGNVINTNLFLVDFTRVVLVAVDTKGGTVKSAPIILQSC